MIGMSKGLQHISGYAILKFVRDAVWAEKPKKISQKRKLEMDLAAALTEVSTLRVENGKLSDRLIEARRRTIPFGLDGKREINFLPLYITQCESKCDFADITCRAGFSEAMPTNKRFELRVIAEMASEIDRAQLNTH